MVQLLQKYLLAITFLDKTFLSYSRRIALDRCFEVNCAFLPSLITRHSIMMLAQLSFFSAFSTFSTIYL